MLFLFLYSTIIYRLGILMKVDIVIQQIVVLVLVDPGCTVHVQTRTVTVPGTHPSVSSRLLAKNLLVLVRTLQNSVRGTSSSSYLAEILVKQRSLKYTARQCILMACIVILTNVPQSLIFKVLNHCTLSLKSRPQEHNKGTQYKILNILKTVESLFANILKRFFFLLLCFLLFLVVIIMQCQVRNDNGWAEDFATSTDKRSFINMLFSWCVWPFMFFFFFALQWKSLRIYSFSIGQPIQHAVPNE